MADRTTSVLDLVAQYFEANPFNQSLGTGRAAGMGVNMAGQVGQIDVSEALLFGKPTCPFQDFHGIDLGNIPVLTVGARQMASCRGGRLGLTARGHMIQRILLQGIHIEDTRPTVCHRV